MESAIQAISQSAKDPWTLVLYNHLAVLPLEEIEKTCNLFGAKHTRVVTICSTIRADGKFLDIRFHIACMHIIIVLFMYR